MNLAFFFEDNPSCLSKLKSCAFFWGKICVYPSFLQGFSNMSQESQEYKNLETLITEKVIKFTVKSKTEFECDLFDDTFCYLDENLREYMYKHSSDFIVKTEVPKDFDNIIRNASLKEYNDNALKKMLDDLSYSSYINSFLEAMDPDLIYNFKDLSPEIQKTILAYIKNVINIEYSQYQELEEKTKYNFEWLNESLIFKNSVSSSILTNDYLYSYYNHKFNNFKIRDANVYLDGLNATIPLMNKENIDNFSMEDILEIRKMKEWKRAMNRLGEICSAAKCQPDTEEFGKEINNKVMSEIFDVIGETRKSKWDLVNNCAKTAIWTGISLISIQGTIFSAIGSMGDAVASHFLSERKQKALPVFINNIRKINK